MQLKEFCGDYSNILVLLPNMSCSSGCMLGLIQLRFVVYIMMIEGSLIDIEEYTVRIKVSIQDGADYFVIFFYS